MPISFTLFYEHKISFDGEIQYNDKWTVEKQNFLPLKPLNEKSCPAGQHGGCTKYWLGQAEAGSGMYGNQVG
jgi:hypothetical protein